MSSNKSGRVLVAAALAAALFLAVPVQATDGRGAALGPLEGLVAWFVETWFAETWLSAESGDATGSAEPETGSDESQTTTPVEDEEDPAGCRAGDYTMCVDPNG